MLVLRAAQKRDVHVLPSERKTEDEIERLRTIARFVGESVETALEILHRSARCDIAEKIAADDALFREPREFGFVRIVLFDIPIEVDGNESERQRIDLGLSEFEEILGVDFHRRGGSPESRGEPGLLVQGLTSDDIDRLAADGRVERIARRAIVPLDGPTVTIVIDGWFRVFRNAAFVRDVTLFLAAAGDVLAPSSLFGERSAESGAEALADAHVLLLAPEAFVRHAESDPELYMRMAVVLGRRVSRVQKRLEELSRFGVEARVAGSLIDLASDFGTPLQAGIKLDLPLSQEDLANLAGTTRESCSSAVAEFARRGFVKGARLKGLVILDREGLAAVAAAGV